MEEGGSELEALWIVVQNFVVLGNSLLVVLLSVSDFADIKLGVGSKIGAAVMLQVVLKFRARQIIFAALNVFQAVGIESVGGRGGAGRSGGA